MCALICQDGRPNNVDHLYGRSGQENGSLHSWKGEPMDMDGRMGLQYLHESKGQAKYAR